MAESRGPGYLNPVQLPSPAELDEFHRTPPASPQPSQPGQLGAEQGAWVRLPSATSPPAGAIALDIVGDANIAPGGVAVLLTQVVPDNYRLRMAAIGFGADDETALQFLTWSIRFGPDTTIYVGTPAAIGSIRQLADIFLLAGSSVTVNVVATIAATSVLTYRYICRMRGWFYMDQEAK